MIQSTALLICNREEKIPVRCVLIVLRGEHDIHFKHLQFLKIVLQAINQNHTSNIFSADGP